MSGNTVAVCCHGVYQCSRVQLISDMLVEYLHPAVGLVKNEMEEQRRTHQETMREGGRRAPVPTSEESG